MSKSAPEDEENKETCMSECHEKLVAKEEELADTVEDYEYLQFMLRITEDILRNDMYTNSGMDKVFEGHIEANKGRLDEAKMRSQIELLKKELNYPLKKTSQLSICLCNKETDSPPGECECATIPKADQDDDCICKHLECSVPDNATKTEVTNSNEKLEVVKVKEIEQTAVISTDAQVAIIEDERVTRFVTSDTPIESGKCIDPNTCSTLPPFAKTIQGSNTDVKSVTTKHSSKSKSANSIYMKLESGGQVVDKNSKVENKVSQVVFYNHEVGEICHCTIALRKTALKIQMKEKDDDEEYILVEGPVCMPKNMLEEKTVQVMIGNLSSLLIDSDMNVGVKQSNSGLSFSRVNLFQQSVIPQTVEKSQHDSISVEILRQVKTVTDYDMTPEREESSTKEGRRRSVAIDSEAAIITNYEETESFAEEIKAMTFGTKSDNSKSESYINESYSSSSSSSGLSYKEQIETDAAIAAIDETYIKRVISESKENEVEAKTSEVLSAKENSSTPRTISETSSVHRPESRHSRSSSVEIKNKSISGTQEINAPVAIRSEETQSRRCSKCSQSITASYSVKSAEPPPRKRSSSSDGAKLCCPSKPKIISDEPVSEKQNLDMTNKYHFLLQDVSTSVTSSDIDAACLRYSAPPPPPPPGPISIPVVVAPPPPLQDMIVHDIYNQPRRSVVLASSAEIFQPRSESGDVLLLPESTSFTDKRKSILVTSDPVVQEIRRTSRPPTQVSSIETDESIDMRYLPRVFDYTTRGQKKAMVAPSKTTGKPFEYAFQRKESVERISEMESLTRSSILDSDYDAENLIPETFPRPHIEKLSLSSANNSETNVPLKPTESKDEAYSEASDASIIPARLKSEQRTVRYSISQEPYDHEEIIKRLDEIPQTDITSMQMHTVQAVTQKLEDFRTIDPNDTSRKFQYSNAENFEIRRQSLSEVDKTNVQPRNVRKPKPTCCGICPAK